MAARKKPIKDSALRELIAQDKSYLEFQRRTLEKYGPGAVFAPPTRVLAHAIAQVRAMGYDCHYRVLENDKEHVMLRTLGGSP